MQSQSQSVSQLSTNINARRLELGLTYEQVYDALLRYPWPAGIKPPSLAVVGHWFNGGRRPRKMEHLVGLCEVLGLTLDEAAGRPTTEASTDEEQALLEAFRRLTGGADREYLLGMALQMGKRPK